MTPAVALTDVSWIAPDGKIVFDHFDLVMMPETTTYVEGAAKAGKTVLCNLLTGLTTPTSGDIAWFDLLARPGFVAQSYVPQTLGLLDDLTVHANIALPLSLARQREDQIWMDEVLERLGISHLLNRSAARVSVGERQRVCIARAMVCQPMILVADEPTAHQDARNAANIMRLLSDVAERGAAVLVTGQEQTTASFDCLITLGGARP
jgi:putative ABC transport system ATP-binding protein